MSESARSRPEQIRALRALVLELARSAAATIVRGTDVLLEMDLFGAHRLVLDDADIDTLALAVEMRCDQLLVLQQPVAGDLREIMAARRVAVEVERIGDLMVNVAKSTRRLYGESLGAPLRDLIARMGSEAARLVRLAIDAYEDRNPALGAALDDLDDRLDDMSNEFVQEIFEAHRGSASMDVRTCVELALIGRCFERVGDHAVSIGQQVRLFRAGGPDPRPTKDDAATSPI